MKNELNSRIKKYRNLADLTQEQVASALNMKPSTYSQMERSGNIKAHLVDPIAKILNVDPVVLLFGEKVEPPVTLPPITPPPEPTLKQPVPPIFVIDNSDDVLPLKNREIQTIKIIRSLPPEKSEEIYKFIHQKHLESKK